MGCDIHSFAEVKTNGKWKKVGKIFQDCYNEKELTSEPYGGRNYDLFAMLADVRNRRGFAGIKTGEGFNPICEPKGLPEDSEYLNSVSPYAYDSNPMNGKPIPIEERDTIRHDVTDCDYHSHSWLTLRELLDYDWNQLTMKTGWVTKAEYIEYKTNGSPNGWCGDVSSGGMFAHVANDEIEAFNTPGKTAYTKIEWGSTYAESAHFFLEHTIPALQNLGDPENVRIVFWFDN